MKGLILETSTEKGCAILTKEGKPLAFTSFSSGPLLSKYLALEIDSMLKKYSFQPDYIALGTGPGSYTGIRVGAALGQALAYGWNIPVFGFCSLNAFIENNRQGSFAVEIDAKRGGLYVLTHNESSPCTLSLAEAKKRLDPIEYFFSPHPEIIKKRIDLPGAWIETSPNISALSELAYTLFCKGDYSPPTLSYGAIS